MQRFWITLTAIILLVATVALASHESLSKELDLLPAAVAETEDPVVYITTGGQTRLLSFTLRQKDNPTLPFDVPAAITEDEILLFVPPSLDLSQAVPYFQTTGDQLLIGGKECIAGETVLDLTNTLSGEIRRGGQRKLQLKIKAYSVDTGLPLVMIDTEDDGTIPKGVNTACSFMLYNNNMSQLQAADVASFIHVRGNSSSDMPKKSYTLTLGEKQALLGMERSRKWLLIANYCDKTLMRNYLAYTLGAEMDGLDYTPQAQYCELFVDGMYMGNYLLCEKVQLASGRLEFEDTSEDAFPVLLEADNRDERSAIMFVSKHGLKYLIRHPEEYTLDEKMRIQFMVNQIEYKVFDHDSERFLEDIDMDSFTDWAILHELFKNVDATFFLSTFIYFDNDGILYMGPPWDFDISAGNGDYYDSGPTGYWNTREDNKYYSYVSAVFAHPESHKALLKRYKELQPLIETIPQRIDETEEMLYHSAKLNFLRWDILDTYVWPNSVVLGSYHKEVDYLRDWFEDRIDWLNDEWGA